jgi:polyisoprenoid-binding protein YceI
MAGTENGNAAASASGLRFKVTLRRWGTPAIDGPAPGGRQRPNPSPLDAGPPSGQGSRTVTRAPRPLIEIRRRTAPPALCVLLAVLAGGPAPVPGQSGAPDSVVYRLVPASRLEVHTGKAGLFGFAGHEHLIRARAFTGRVVYFPAAPAAARVEITVLTDSLEVLTPPDTAEIRKVTEAMRTDVLQVERYRAITFVSKRIAPTSDGFRIDAELTMAGQTREVPVEARVEIGPDTLRATASFAVKQTDFGIKPFRGGPAGTVRVADRVRFDIDAVAVR